MDKQYTIAKEATFSGIGLHTGNLATLTFKPAPANSGVTFHRVDLPDSPAIKADVNNVTDTSRGTTISNGDANVHTVEHVLAAVVGAGLDNLDIEVDANETPLGDGSSLPFTEVLQEAGRVEQDADRTYITITEPVHYQNGEVQLTILPADEMRITMTIDFNHVAIGTQHATFTLIGDTFNEELSSARTFCFLREVKELQDKGLIRGGTLENAVVVGDESILNDDLRYDNEMVRHKILDLYGDIFLIGGRIKGHVIAVKSGHATHVEFTKKIRKSLEGAKKPAAPIVPEPILTVNDIKNIIPHRYPVLLVDRVVEYEPNVVVRGLKNVTNNEPFFNGHWPDNPVMPGVLIIEALAQVTSVLIFGPEGPSDERRAYFMGIDQCKFRKIVVPGDQLILEATTIKLRRNAARVLGKAYVNGAVVAEAEMMFILR